MSHLLKKIFQNHGTRVLSLLFVSMMLLIAYFLVHSYVVQLDIHKTKIIGKLKAISTTAATQLDGNQLSYLLNRYEGKNDIKSNDQDPVYQLLHESLKKIQLQNEIETPLYTLSLNESGGGFFFGLSSSDQPFFRHVYDKFPEGLRQNYLTGGVLDVYEDENGHWISAFAPIKTSNGEVVAVVQADQRFDVFLMEARKEIFNNIGISLIFTLVLMFFLIRSMRNILNKEDELTANLLQSKLELEQKNQDTLDSIIYAKKIQEAILPLKTKIRKYLPESFVFHRPRDIVSGDFYWFKFTRGKIFVASVDCTGHGVPGAFMSMIGSILLDDIINKKEVNEPEEILEQLHLGIVKALKQSYKSKASSDGMDVALCVIDISLNTLTFSGAFRPLIFIRNGELNRIRATPLAIGGFRDESLKFTRHEIALEKGDQFYIFSDGYP